MSDKDAAFEEVISEMVGTWLVELCGEQAYAMQPAELQLATELVVRGIIYGAERELQACSQWLLGRGEDDLNSDLVAEARGEVDL